MVLCVFLSMYMQFLFLRGKCRPTNCIQNFNQIKEFPNIVNKKHKIMRMQFSSELLPILNSEFGTGTPQDPRTILLIGDIRAIGDVSDIPQAVTEFITFCFNIFLCQLFVYNQQSRSPLDLMECFLYFPPKSNMFLLLLMVCFHLNFC